MHSLSLKRRLNAPAELVYSAWTEPERMGHWFCPAQSEVLYAESSTRVGGKYRVIMRTPDGEKHTAFGEYLLVVPNEKLVFSWQWVSEPEVVSEVTVTFESDGNATDLTLTHELLPTESSRDGHREGWTGALENLAAYLA